MTKVDENYQSLSCHRTTDGALKRILLGPASLWYRSHQRLSLTYTAQSCPATSCNSKLKWSLLIPTMLIGSSSFSFLWKMVKLRSMNQRSVTLASLVVHSSQRRFGRILQPEKPLPKLTFAWV